ncbi:hypothetical protein KC19_11G103600 [Ceratodon purpureus]|uniref:Uncharacterized protein n=1 Tax=Ceratodon purpureus TaxID=3225 RepID=A0A8T0GG17_CERPU|nr:hypothetical protein KC19_11G103600 [Ceratodon purpureus]
MLDTLTVFFICGMVTLLSLQVPAHEWNVRNLDMRSRVEHSLIALRWIALCRMVELCFLDSEFFWLSLISTSVSVCVKFLVLVCISWPFSWFVGGVLKHQMPLLAFM